MDLVPGKEYYITTHDTHLYFKMIFNDYQTSFSNMGLDYINLNMIFIQKYSKDNFLFYEQDYYYDPEKIRENAQNARQQMEQRALNAILKKIVNENFEW